MGEDRVLRGLLVVGVAVPFLYFGAQLLAVPFYPGYSMVSQVASELGSPQSNQPWVLNSLVVLTGVAQLVAAYAVARGLFKIGAWPWITWVIGLMLLMGAMGTIKAGIYPMPDPRHSNMGYLATSLMVFPALLLAALWPFENTVKLRIYLGASVLVILCLMPLLSGGIGDVQSIKGLLQRVFALAAFPPIGVASAYLRRQLPVT